MSPRFPTSPPPDYFPPLIKWLDDHADEPSTPFGDDSTFPRDSKTRPLRVTLDVSAVITPADRAVAQTFLDFRDSSLLELRINDPRMPGGVSLPAITDDLPAHLYPHVEVQGDGWTSTVTLMMVGEMKKLLDQHGLEESRAQLALASFHKGWHGDLLVTTDIAMHELARKVGYFGMHVVTPKVGLRLFGLLLRYHEQYTIRAKPNHIIGRWPFYWSLARQSLPGFWRYFSACLDCPDATIGRAGDSILHRAARALEARDFVGYEHYGPGF